MTELEAFQKILHQIKKNILYDCSDYKIKCLKRRINVRVRATKTEDYSTYLEYLKNNPDEFEKLAKSLTINVTRFFRNKPVFDIIEDRIIDFLIDSRRKKNVNTLYIWSAGCSSGEEVYTLAIIADNVLKRRYLSRTMSVKIIGTDIDQTSLEKAKAGIFQENSFTETPQEVIRDYFTIIHKHNKTYFQIDEKIKEMTRFFSLNLVTESPEFSCDLILCRNVLIYFNKDLQEKVFNKLTEATNPGGYIVLGKTETLIGFSLPPDIGPFDKKERIYYKQEK
jgi:chemotaxis protein methyltransferase CheR